MASVSIKLAYKRWKKNLEITPSSSELTLVSLYDLLYSSDGILWSTKASSSTSIGTNLGHDVICFNESMLTKTGAVDTSTQMESSLFATFGIDVSIPKYDARAKQRTIQNTKTISISNSTSNIFNNNEYTIYDKDSALAPTTLDMFTINGILINGNSTAGWDTYMAPSIATLDSTGTVSDSYDIYLAKKDTAFSSTLATRDSYSAYNTIFLNPNTRFTQILLMKALNINSSVLFQSDTSQYKTEQITYQNMFSNSGNSVPNILNTGNDKFWFNLLSNTFVWVRAPFFGDYIKEESFDQDLNPEAKVVHKELMISGAGDFKKYDKWLQTNQTKVSNVNEDGRSEYTVPYLPKTTPTVDFYTNEFLENNLDTIIESDTNGNYSSKLSDAYKKSASNTIEDWLNSYIYGNDMPISSLPVAPINRNTAATSTSIDGDSDIDPPGYFDTESRKTDTDYRNMGKFPTIIPSDGNAYVDGRIISPTIDELWYMIKKLISGRASDIKVSNGTSSPNSTRSKDLDIAVPFGRETNKKNDKNTTMTEVYQSEYNFDYNTSSDTEHFNKYGDPVDWEYTSQTDANGINNTKVKITKFINQNDAIVYPIYGNLKSLSTKVTSFGKDNGNPNRGISNFTAWNTIVASDNDTTIADGASITSSDSSIWAPRNEPYSLRELESLIMGNKYNIITFARFVKENFTVSGGLGKETISKYLNSIVTDRINPTDEIKADSDKIYTGRQTKNSTDDLLHANESAGSLYQLHKNYNFKVDNPNTYYSRFGTNDGSGTNGAKAIYRDLDNRTNTADIKAGNFGTTEKDEFTITDTTTGKINTYSRDVRIGRFTTTKYTTRLREDYGTDPSLDENQDIIASENVYLAADGTWRHIADHVRIPILRCRF